MLGQGLGLAGAVELLGCSVDETLEFVDNAASGALAYCCLWVTVSGLCHVVILSLH